MTNFFNLSRTLARPRNPADIHRTLNLMKAIHEAGQKETTVQTDIPGTNETLALSIPVDPQPR